MKYPGFPSFSSFVTQREIDQARMGVSMASFHYVSIDSKFEVGEDVVVWLYGPGEPTAINGIVVDLKLVPEPAGNTRGFLVYSIAVAAQQEGIYLVLHDVPGNFSKKDTIKPEYEQTAWPKEYFVSEPPPKGSHLKRIK